MTVRIEQVSEEEYQTILLKSNMIGHRLLDFDNKIDILDNKLETNITDVHIINHPITSTFCLINELQVQEIYIDVETLDNTLDYIVINSIVSNNIVLKVNGNKINGCYNMLSNVRCGGEIDLRGVNLEALTGLSGLINGVEARKLMLGRVNSNIDRFHTILLDCKIDEVDMSNVKIEHELAWSYGIVIDSKIGRLDIHNIMLKHYTPEVIKEMFVRSSIEELVVSEQDYSRISKLEIQGVNKVSFLK